MKLATILFTAAAALSAVYADEGAGVVKAAEEATTTPATTKPAADKDTAAPSPTTKKTSSGSGDAAPAPVPAGASPLDGLKQKAYGKDYHMPYVRVVQARVQSDKPDFVKGRFISKFGKGDLQKGYMSAMDSVNMASVEGALMFVQAEGINQNTRSAKDRCRRKNEMNYVVLYEILIAQTNETIAQYSDNWNVPEYGPMLPMDAGRCTPLKGEEFPAECLMYNGVNDYPNIGPFVGAGLKNNDIRAPYPNAFWFSFPHTCPLKVWGEKDDINNACRTSSRKGLCDIGKAPDGVECTFSYDILGWVPIDDVVGITDIKDPSGKPYGNFTLWCEASKEHVEFAGSEKGGEMTAGLPFWEEPLKPERNAKRASKVIELYQEIYNKDFKSIQIDGTDLKNFKALPDPKELAKINPPCYKTVPKCNSGFGCARSGFSQICIPCKSASPDCKTDPSFKFPTLAKAVTPKKEEELKSDLGGKMGATGSVLTSNSSSSTTAKPSSGTAASSATSVPLALGAFATLAASAIAVLTL